MKLIEYLEQKDIAPFSRSEKAAAFCETLGISRVYLGNLATGRRRPSGNLAFRIEDATEGQVTARELLMPDDEEEKEAA